MKALDGRELLAIKGVQTLSFSTHSVAATARDLERIGVASLRLSPHTGDFAAVCNGYADLISGRMTARELVRRLVPHVPGRRLSDGFLRGGGGVTWSGNATSS